MCPSTKTRGSKARAIWWWFAGVIVAGIIAAVLVHQFAYPGASFARLVKRQAEAAVNSRTYRIGAGQVRATILHPALLAQARSYRLEIDMVRSLTPAEMRRVGRVEMLAFGDLDARQQAALREVLALAAEMASQLGLTHESPSAEQIEGSRLRFVQYRRGAGIGMSWVAKEGRGDWYLSMISLHGPSMDTGFARQEARLSKAASVTQGSQPSSPGN